MSATASTRPELPGHRHVEQVGEALAGGGRQPDPVVRRHDAALDAAQRHVTNDELAEVLPLLQSAVLPRSLQLDARANDLSLDDLRTGLSERLGIDPHHANRRYTQHLEQRPQAEQHRDTDAECYTPHHRFGLPSDRDLHR